LSLSTSPDQYSADPEYASRHSARSPEYAPRLSARSPEVTLRHSAPSHEVTLRHSARSPEGAKTQNLGRPRGVRLGIDVGKARIGVAGSDPDGLLAMPIATVRRQPGTDIAQIVKIARERNAIAVYLGLPKHMSGKEGESAADARKFAAALATKLPDLEFRFIDERLTTVTAAANLHAAGRKASRQKSVIDQQAAVIILQTALDAERASEQLAGSPIAGTER